MALALTSCGGSNLPTVPERPGGGGGSSVDPGACGNYAEIDIGRRVKSFLEATVQVQSAVFNIEKDVRSVCVDMGKELGFAGAKLEGDTGPLCDAVAAELKGNLRAGLKGSARLKVTYEPAVCTVDASVAAKAAAQCEGKASADVTATCSGTCSGTCKGACKGTCEGDNSGGDCNGACDGTCDGTCEGSCSGEAEVEAEANCKASAEVTANANVECTEPKLELDYDSTLVVDAVKFEASLKAIQQGLPRLLALRARVQGPLKGAVKMWARTGKKLAQSGQGAFKALGAQAVCVTGQISASVAAAAEVNASMSVSVEASASVSGSAGAGG